MRTWEQAESMVLRDLRAAIDNDPRVLLDCDGGPEGMRADIIYADMIDHEERVTTQRMSSVRAVWLTPKFPRLNRRAVADEDVPSPTLDAIEWRLQSGYAYLNIDPATINPPEGVSPNPATYYYSVALVRYRERIRV